MILVSLVNKWLTKKARKEFIRNVTYRGKAESLEILRGAKARPFRGSVPGDILIENDFRFFSGTLVSQNGGKIEIADHVKFGFNCLVGAANHIKIGSYTTFADNITIMDNNNHSVNPLDRAIMYRTPHNSDYRGWKYSDSAPVVIGNNVWCGSNVRIGKGVTIGDGAVIAANTVVVKDVPANSICAGNPGKIVKTDIDKLPRLIPDDAI